MVIPDGFPKDRLNKAVERTYNRGGIGMRIEVNWPSPVGFLFNILCAAEGEKEVKFDTFEVRRHGWGFDVDCEETITYFDLKEMIERINTAKTYENIVLYEYEDGERRKDTVFANVIFRLINNPKVRGWEIDLYENGTGRMTMRIFTVPPAMIIEEMKWIPKPGFRGEYHSVTVQIIP